jgi:hypothetical protein
VLYFLGFVIIVLMLTVPAMRMLAMAVLGLAAFALIPLGFWLHSEDRYGEASMRQLALYLTAGLDHPGNPSWVNLKSECGVGLTRDRAEIVAARYTIKPQLNT